MCLCGRDEQRAGRSLEISQDFKDVKGVGKSTLEMLDEFIKTGTCSILDELEGTDKTQKLQKS